MGQLDRSHVFGDTHDSHLVTGLVIGRDRPDGLPKPCTAPVYFTVAYEGSCVPIGVDRRSTAQFMENAAWPARR